MATKKNAKPEVEQEVAPEAEPQGITFERVDEVPARTRKRTSVLNAYLDEFLRDPSKPLKVAVKNEDGTQRDVKSTAIGLINLVKSRKAEGVKVTQRQGVVYLMQK